MFEDYEKEYENVFTDIKKIKNCRPGKISTDIGLSFEEYRDLFKATIDDHNIKMFDDLVKIVWLIYRFTYHGKRRKRNRNNGQLLDRAYSVFTRHHVGFEPKLIFDIKNFLF